MKPLIIYEIANNHMGDLSHAKKIIDKYFKISKEYKDKFDFAFKFQFRDLNTYIHNTFKNIKHDQVARFTSTKLNSKQWDQILKYCKKNFKIICTPFDEKSVDLILKKNFDYLKIASCSVDEWPLLEHIAKCNKSLPMISSLGGADRNKISNIISFFKNKKKNIKYLYCVAKYPTHPSDLNLEYFEYLRSIYGDIISGFSSHEDPNETLTGSICYAMGARIFEKHVNIPSKKYSINKYSTTPKQMSKWLKNLSLTVDRIGSITKREKFINYEKNNLSVFKRGMYLKDNISIRKGQIIKKNDVIFAFPCQKGQMTSNEFTKFNKITAKKNFVGNLPILKTDVSIVNQRKDIEVIRDKIINLISKSKIIIPKKQRLEISHHKGIENFYKIGMCMITVHNSNYCKKLLFLFKNQEHPAQYHKIKQETFFILHGKIKILIKQKNKKISKILNVGDIFTIYPQDIHSFTCLSKDGCVIEELSSKSMKEDSYYVDKLIMKNKNRKSYILL